MTDRYKQYLQVVELFTSINGEGTRAGQLSVFVRMKGCNLNCGYCDTKWANEEGTVCQNMSVEEICRQITDSGVTNVTLTGGEPLLQEHIQALTEALAKQPQLYVEIETNGSVSLEPWKGMHNRPSMTMDYKLPSSGMENAMKTENFTLLEPQDTVKFVCGSQVDLERAKEVIDAYDLTTRCHVYLSPVFGQIRPVDMVTFMKEHNMNGVNLQLQLHKMIWNPDERGV